MRAVSADRPRSIGLNVANLEGGKPERLAPRVRAWRTLGLVVLLQVAAELLDRFFLVGAEVADQGHLPAGPVDAGVLPVGVREHQQMMVRDLDVIVYLLPRDAGRHQAD